MTDLERESVYKCVCDWLLYIKDFIYAFKVIYIPTDKNYIYFSK